MTGSFEPTSSIRGALAQHSRGTAFVVRYFHGALSFVILLVALGLFFVAEGEARRSLWDAMGTFLGANGVASVIGMPVLLAITARWRRASELPFRDVELDPRRGAIVVRMADGGTHRISRDRVRSVYVESVPGGFRRVVLTMRGRVPGDTFVFVVEDALADELTTFIGARPSSFDVGVRGVQAAGWTFSLSYAACCVFALVCYALLRGHVPRAVFEPYAATASAGWALGLGVGVFAPIHAWLGLVTTMPTITVGVDGLLVRRPGATARFWSWRNIVAVERDGSTLRLVLGSGARESVRLWPVGSRRVEALLRLVRQRAEAASAGTDVASLGEGEGRMRGAAYRQSMPDDAELEARLVSAGVSRERRVRIARRLAAQGERGTDAVRGAAATIAEPDLREALAEIAEAADEIDGVAPTRRVVA